MASKSIYLCDPDINTFCSKAKECRGDPGRFGCYHTEHAKAAQLNLSGGPLRVIDEMVTITRYDGYAHKEQARTVSADNVNHPGRYETGKFECIDVMLETQGREAVKNFCICNAFKYLYRHGRKNGREDIEKAVWYLKKYLELTGDGNEENVNKFERFKQVGNGE